MSKPSLKDLLKIGLGVGSMFAPGAAKPILDLVNKSIGDDSDPANVAALRTLAQANEDEDAAIRVLHERLSRCEAKLGI